ADAVEERVGFGAFLRQPPGGLGVEPFGIAPVVRARRTIAHGHFVIRSVAQKSPFVRSEQVPCHRARRLSIMYLRLLRRNVAPSQSADRRGWCCLVRYTPSVPNRMVQDTSSRASAFAAATL